jgi:site-specific DNA-methyltransferase (adenine-specific)
MEKYKNKIICADCIEWLSRIDEPFADLVFADPPFNIGYKYDRYHDKKDKTTYAQWTYDWMAACKKALKAHGSFYVAIGDEHAADVKNAADKLDLKMRNWIIWHYTFGQQSKNKFARAHTHVLYFVKDPKNFIFNDHAIRVPSDRQLLYNDKRANPRGKIPDDVWNSDSRVCGTFNERTGWHPCQMPETLLKRIIAVSSDPGQFVLDPFSGSATTAAAACQMDRDYLGLELSEDYVQKSRRRLEETEENLTTGGSSDRLTADELNRLLNDIRMSPKEVLEDNKLLEIITKQLNVRMNKGASHETDHVARLLAKMTGRTPKTAPEAEESDTSKGLFD